MQYIKKDLGAYKAHIIKTKKFKTITLQVNFRRKIEKEDITIRNLLRNMLTESSKNYKTKKALTIKAQDLYAADISISNSRLGNYINTDFYLEVLNDKYTEKGNFYKSLDFCFDVLFNPDVTDNKFNKEKLDIQKSLYKTSLEKQKEDSQIYSVQRMFEEMDSNSPSSYRMLGYISDIDKVNEKNLYKYYKSMLEQDLVDIFIIGDIDEEEFIEYLKTNFKIKTFKKQKAPYRIEEVKPKQKKNIVKGTINSKQSNLAIGCRLYNLDDYERNYVLSLYNVILGGYTDSLLFKDVREKNSLCYTIGSVPNKLDNVLLIRAGIDKENYKKTIELIEKDMNAMKKGKFTENDLKVAKEFYETALDTTLESPSRVIYNYFMMDLLNTDDLETKRKKMNKVVKEEIIKVAKKVKIDTIFLLEGDDNEKDIS